MSVPDPEKLRVITSWLRGLAHLTRSDRADDEAIALMAAMLEPEFASSAFNQRTLRAVAAGTEFWPSFAELSRLLREWLADQAPPALPPPDPAGGGLRPEDQAWLDHWNKTRAALLARDDEIRRSGKFSDPAQLPLARLASLIRQQSPKAWALIAKGA
jgi:hypothetical protein